MENLNAFERFTRKSVWPAYVGFLWAVLYAVFVRFYEAAGGLLGDVGAVPKEPESFYMGSYMAGVFILFCGFILLALVKPWGRLVPSWIPFIGGYRIPYLLLLIPTLIGTAFALAHGIAGIIANILFLQGLIIWESPGFIVYDAFTFALWDLLFYEPWFLMMGVLSGLAAAHYVQEAGISLSYLRRGTILYAIFVVLLTMLFTSAIVFDFVDKISF